MHRRCLFSESVVATSSIFTIGMLIMTMLVGDVHLTSEDSLQHHYPHDFNYIINHAEMCNSSEAIQLFIMVHSACHHFQSRLTVRHTWGSAVKRQDVKLLFLLGSPTEKEFQQHILEEDQTFGDILQEDFLDTYYNLTLKSIMMVKWVTTHCSRARYVLKIDDDCFLNPGKLMSFLNQNLMDVAIYGRVWRSYSPHRDKDSKWYMPVEMYPDRRYPDFAAGPSYLLTQKAVPLLFATALTTKSIYLEDVYLNGICAEKAKIPRINDEGFYVDSKTLRKMDILRKKVLTSHEFRSEKLHLLWWLLHDTRGTELDNVLISGGY